MRQSIVGVFDRPEAAHAAIEALAQDGFGADAIQVGQADPAVTAAVAAAPEPLPAAGVVGQAIERLARALAGSEQIATPDGGAPGALVRVEVDDSALASRAELALVAAGAVDVTHRTLA